MRLFTRLFIYCVFLVSLTSCNQIFEVDADVQARKALLDLAEIQKKFYQENSRYATSFADVHKHGLKYHTGIVYMEIETAGKDKYRAIALPAESTTARAFAFDTEQGGFYEMEQDEVSRYVLGALKHIRKEIHEKKLNEITAWVLLSGLLFLALRFFTRYRSPENNNVIWAYILCLPALGWAVALMGNMASNVVFTSTISQYTWAGLALSLVALAIEGLWLMKSKSTLPPPPILSLSICTMGISLLSAGVMIYMLKTYS